MPLFDVVIVGAGTGGSTVAIGCAERGFSVALIERWKRGEIRKVCGDATALAHFTEASKFVGVGELQDNEILSKIDGVDVFSPDRKTKLRIVDEGGTGVMIDRFALGKRLVNTAEERGATFFDSTRCTDVITDPMKGVVGVTIRDKKSGELQDINGKIIVDASGIGGFIRRRLDTATISMDKDFDGRDVVYAYREVRDTEVELEDPTYIRIFFDQDLAPGGYYWEFPRGPHSMNVGLGVETSGDYPSAKELLVKHVEKDPQFQNSKVVHAGGARVPLRRPIDSQVYDGLILVGDAGSQVKATDGGGIGISIKSGGLAVNTIANVLENNDSYKTEDLWEYNVNFMRTIAKVNAPLAIIKKHMVQLRNSEINTILSKRIVTENDLMYGNATGQLPMSKIEMLIRAFKGYRILPILLSFRRAFKKMDKARLLYETYPESPSEFKDWQRTVEPLFRHPDPRR